MSMMSTLMTVMRKELRDLSRDRRTLLLTLLFGPLLYPVLLLGMGIDYGIFLIEHRGDASAWLAVCVGAASTWLSFGLLGLSQTPALRAFGLTLLFGIGLVWLISPLFRPPPHDLPPA